MYKKPLDISHLCIYDCIVWMHTPDQYRTKLDLKSQKCIFVGYTNGTKAYRCYNHVTRNILISANIKFNEHSLWHSLFSSSNPTIAFESIFDRMVAIEVPDPILEFVPLQILSPPLPLAIPSPPHDPPSASPSLTPSQTPNSPLFCVYTSQPIIALSPRKPLLLYKILVLATILVHLFLPLGYEISLALLLFMTLIFPFVSNPLESRYPINMFYSTYTGLKLWTTNLAMAQWHNDLIDLPSIIRPI